MKFTLLLAPLFALTRGKDVSDCFSMGKNIAGMESGEEVNNKMDLIMTDASGSSSALFENDMRMRRIVACTDGLGDVVGLHMSLKNEDETDTLSLTSIGYMRMSVEKNKKADPDCRGVSLDDEINEISYSASNGKVNAVHFTKGAAKLSFGELGDDAVTETFSDTKVLFGMHGYEENDEIKSLHFLILDTECLDSLKMVETVKDEVMDKKDDMQMKVAESEPEMEMMNPMIFIIIGAIVVVVILVIVVICCVMKKSKSGEQKVKVEVMNNPSPAKKEDTPAGKPVLYE